jgi:ribosomal protein S21
MRDTKPKKTYQPTNAAKGGDTKAVETVSDHQPIQAQPLEVKVYNGNFDKAFRTFRALVQKARVLSTYKERQSFEKPSDKKRRKRQESKRKQLERSTFSERKPRKRSRQTD